MKLKHWRRCACVSMLLHTLVQASSQHEETVQTQRSPPTTETFFISPAALRPQGADASSVLDNRPRLVVGETGNAAARSGRLTSERSGKIISSYRHALAAPYRVESGAVAPSSDNSSERLPRSDGHTVVSESHRVQKGGPYFGDKSGKKMLRSDRQTATTPHRIQSGVAPLGSNAGEKIHQRTGSEPHRLQRSVVLFSDSSGKKIRRPAQHTTVSEPHRLRRGVALFSDESGKRRNLSHRYTLTAPYRVRSIATSSHYNFGEKIHQSVPLGAGVSVVQHKPTTTLFSPGTAIHRNQTIATPQVSSADGTSQPKPTSRPDASRAGVNASDHHFVLSTAQVVDCLLNGRRLSFALSSGGIYVENLVNSPQLLNRYLQCDIEVKVPDGKFMSVHISSTRCHGHASGYHYELREVGYRRPLVLFRSSHFCDSRSQPVSETAYTSLGATFVFNLMMVPGVSLDPFTVNISLTSFPRFHRLLRVRMTSPLSGFISSPNWNGLTPSFLVMNTVAKVAIPADHMVMISLFQIDCDRIKKICTQKSFVGLYQRPMSRPLAVFCGNRLPRPSAYALASGVLYVRFVSSYDKNGFASGGFKLHFSFCTPSAMLAQRADGTWNCSASQWPDFRHHFRCNFQADCVGLEDEAECPYTMPGCGPGRLTIADRCYVYLRVPGMDSFKLPPASSKMSWEMAEQRCRERRGHLASPRTYQEMQALTTFLSNDGSSLSFVGLVPVGSSNFLYRHVRKTPDHLIIHYASFRRHQCVGRDWSGAAVINSAFFLVLNRHCPLEQDNNLCEVPPAITGTLSGGRRGGGGSSAHGDQDTKTIPPAIPLVSQEQDRAWWNGSVYNTCPEGHKTYAFLACDVHSKCWAARDMQPASSSSTYFSSPSSTSPVSCSGLLKPFPPSLTCDEGLRRVPYTLVCDHRPHCYDHADEDFCVFAACDIMTHFQCTNKACLPFKLWCDGVEHCSDASDEHMCSEAFFEPPIKLNTYFPSLVSSIVVFDGTGKSLATQLSQNLILDKKRVRGKVVMAHLVRVTLICDSLTERTPESGTLVSGILVLGYLHSGTLVNEPRENGSSVSETVSGISFVRGILVSGTLIKATRGGSIVKGEVVNGTLISGTITCPNTHFRCADDIYCLPMYTRCNDLYDCPGGEDEAGCDSYQCPGFYRCRGARMCVHKLEMCDGVKHCPQMDDELLCDPQCPRSCTCYGLAFFCPRVTSLALHPELRYLDATGSGISVLEVKHNTMLVHLSLVRCNISDWAPVTLLNLRSLDLNSNEVAKITSVLLHHLPNLRHMTLTHNPLTSGFLPEMESGRSFPSLRSLDVSGVLMPQLNVTKLSVIPSLSTLNLTGCGLDSVLGDSLQSVPQLRVLDLRGCPLTFFPRDLLRGLGKLVAVEAENFKLCCPAMLPAGFYLGNCKAPLEEVSSCEALLRSNLFRVSLCVFAVLSCVGNLASLFFRMTIFKNKRVSGFDMFVSNLCVSDFLMGFYLAIIGVADRLYMGEYLWNDIEWRHSVSCKVAGFLSLLSSEVSAFVICLITLDRFLVLRFPFSQFRFNKTTAFLACLLIWSTCFVVAAVPLLPVTSHWQFYSQTGICVPLPITGTDFKGHGYSFSVMIVLNFVLFVMVALGQLLVYLSVQSHKMPAVGDNTNALNKDQTLARRLITVAVSDFLCWFPIGLSGVMAANGYDVPSEVNTVMAIFVLPFNSAINPFLYTLNIALERRWKARERRVRQFWLSKLNSQGTSSSSRACLHCRGARKEGRQPLKP